MQRLHNDPLLGSARALLFLFIALLIFATVMLAIGVLAVLTVQRGELSAEIAEAGLAPSAYWGVVAGLAALLAILYLALRFTLELERIVTSVDKGDPFVDQNAGRLARMGWLALTIQLIGLPLSAAAAYLEKLMDSGPSSMGFSGSGLLLVLVLFILARVFRKGALMRSELEGTV